jgi:ABC-type transport system involved in multi-copper enzyme maturation permease subunit
MDTLRMINAELLKLRRRSLILWTAALTVGVSIALVTYDALRHHIDPARYGPAGGITNLGHAMQLLAYLGTVAAVLVGTTAGGQDQASGVLRDLISTGRPRWVLFGVRVPAAIVFYLAAFLPAFLVSAVASVALAGPLPAPPARMLVEYGLGIALSGTLDVVLGVGLAALVGSRSVAIGVLLGWELALTRLLEHMTTFGAARQLLASSAVDRILPGMGAPHVVPMSLPAAGAALVGWALLAFAAGAWRTTTRDA